MKSFTNILLTLYNNTRFVLYVVHSIFSVYEYPEVVIELSLYSVNKLSGTK